jgi:large subunit ribosomal protein L24|tara:strand:- start:995 stop:1243 length:249 start_codon:yes stop_codon:yes gene_type:complete
MNYKKGIQVKIIAGKDKGKTGEILEINRKDSRVKIKSINMIKKHLKPTKENKGGIISKESFIHISNIKNIDIKKDQKKEIKK